MRKNCDWNCLVGIDFKLFDFRILQGASRVYQAVGNTAFRHCEIEFALFCRLTLYVLADTQVCHPEKVILLHCFRSSGDIEFVLLCLLTSLFII